jgi:hypothetical protein
MKLSSLRQRRLPEPSPIGKLEEFSHGPCGAGALTREFFEVALLTSKVLNN